MVTMMFFYMTLLGITMVLLFVGSRLSRWKTLLIVYGFTVLAMAAEIVLIRFWGTDTLSRVYILMVHLPALLLFYFIGYYRGWALIFQFLSAMLFCALIQQGAGLAYYLFGNRLWVIVAAYLLFTAAVLWFLLGYLRPLIAGVLLEIQQGLWSMCLVIAIYWLITVYMVPGYVGLDPSSTAFKPILSLLMVGFYVVVITLFSTAQREAESRHNAQISALSLGQHIPQLCGGHLHHTGDCQGEDPRLGVGAVQVIPLDGEQLLCVRFCPAEGGNPRQGQNLLGRVPCLKCQEHIRPHQQPQLVLWILRPQLPQSLSGVAPPLPLQLQIQNLDLVPQAQLLCRQAGHLQPLGRRGTARRQGLVGRLPVRHHQQQIQLQQLKHRPGRRHMAQVRRVERPAVNTDLHMCSLFMVQIFPLAGPSPSRHPWR